MLVRGKGLGPLAAHLPTLVLEGLVSTSLGIHVVWGRGRQGPQGPVSESVFRAALGGAGDLQKPP